jgi:putative spermidine/putrescine transport system permease protein
VPALLPYLLVYIPALAILVVLSVFHYAPGQWPQAGFTLASYSRFFTTHFYVHLFLSTFTLAAIASVAAVAVSYPLAYSIVRSRRWRRVILPIVTISFFVSAILVLYGWIAILGRYGVLNGVLDSLHLTSQRTDILFTNKAVLIGLADSAVPFAVLILAAAINNVDPNLELAAENLGATRIQTFFRVTLPLTRTGVIVALALSFAQSISAFVIPLLLGGGRVPMLATQVYDSMIISLNYPFASATVVIILVVTLILLAATDRLGNRRMQPQR